MIVWVLLAMGAYGVLAGLLLRLRYVQAGPIFGYSPLGRFLVGVGMLLWGTLGESVHWVGTVVLVAGAITERGARPPREPKKMESTKLGL